MGRSVIDTEATCRNLKEMLEKQNYTAKEVQFKLGLETVQAVYKWLSPNNRTIPSLDSLVQLADMLECSVEDILVYKESDSFRRRRKMIICDRCGAVIDETRARHPYGEIITFGEYWQYLDKYLGKSALQWRVLERRPDGTVLMISREAIDVRAFDDDWISLTWERSKLREWLNGEFMNEAFSPEEREKFVTVRNVNKDNPKYGTPGGSDTYDKVFLLSIDEAVKYFMPEDPFNNELLLYPTKYARAQGLSISRGLTCFWWLRTPGECVYNCTNMATVMSDGTINMHGASATDKLGIRPVIALDGNKL